MSVVIERNKITRQRSRGHRIDSHSHGLAPEPKISLVAGSLQRQNLYDLGHSQRKRFNNDNQLYSQRNRDYSASLGRWGEQDPAGYVDGANLYQFVTSNPLGKQDPLGLAPSASRPS